MSDQEGHRLPRLRRQLQPLQHRLRQTHALGSVIGLAPLPDVVIEQRESQQLGRVHLGRASRRSARAPGFEATWRSCSMLRIVSSVCSSTV